MIDSKHYLKSLFSLPPKNTDKLELDKKKHCHDKAMLKRAIRILFVLKFL